MSTDISSRSYLVIIRPLSPSTNSLSITRINLVKTERAKRGVSNNKDKDNSPHLKDANSMRKSWKYPRLNLFTLQVYFSSATP